MNSACNESPAYIASQAILSFLLQVTVFSTSEKKREEALKVLKADHFIVSKDEEQMKVGPCKNFYPFIPCRGVDMCLM